MVLGSLVRFADDPRAASVLAAELPGDRRGMAVLASAHHGRFPGELTIRPAVAAGIVAVTLALAERISRTDPALSGVVEDERSAVEAHGPAALVLAGPRTGDGAADWRAVLDTLVAAAAGTGGQWAARRLLEPALSRDFPAPGPWSWPPPSGRPGIPWQPRNS